MFDRRKFITKMAMLMTALHLPFPKKTKASVTDRPLIIRVHSPQASRPWDYQKSFPWDHTVEPKNKVDMDSTRFRQDRYYDFINQDVVTSMLNQGIKLFTGSNNTGDGWKMLLKDYQEGQKITIKVNLNNASFNEIITTNRMDQSVQIINGLINSLTSTIGADQADITIADPSRWIHPKLLIKKCPFTRVNWVDSRTTDLWDPLESVVFTKDQPIRPKKPNFPEKGTFHLARVYTEADHILNVCLLKNHGCGITGAMKNHFGAIPTPFQKYLHQGLGSKSYIGDVCNTPTIRNKVRLNICEAIFANWHNNVWCPRPWKTFAGATPNSLFFGTDPVAFDSVLLQHVIKEVDERGESVDDWVREAVKNHTFLDYAMNSLHLGIHEHNPFKIIDYREFEAI